MQFSRQILTANSDSGVDSLMCGSFAIVVSNIVFFLYLISHEMTSASSTVADLNDEKAKWKI